MKRLAATAAMTLGVFQVVSTFGAFPASAAAPSIPDDGSRCGVTNSTLFVYAAKTDALSGNASLQINSDTDSIVCTASDQSATVDVTTFEAIVVAAEGDFTMKLKDTATDRAGSFPDVSYSLAARAIKFDGSGVADRRDDLDISVSDDSFDLGISGDVSYVVRFEFLGGPNGDVFDASDATVPVNAIGGGGADLIRGGDGDDSIEGRYGNDRLFGGAGDDSLDCSEAAVENEGPPGSDDIDHRSEADQCWGGDGDDEIDANAPGQGLDTVAPGDGEDDFDNAAVLTYVDSSAGIKVDLASGDDLVESDAGDDAWSGAVGRVIGSPKADTIAGTAAGETLTGGGGDDTLLGRGGNDTVVGGGGADTMKGGGGDDTVTAGGGNDTVRAGAGVDKVNGGTGDDVIYGGDGDDSLIGDAGDDQAWGGAGKDLCIAETKDGCEYSSL